MTDKIMGTRYVQKPSGTGRGSARKQTIVESSWVYIMHGREPHQTSWDMKAAQPDHLVRLSSTRCANFFLQPRIEAFEATLAFIMFHEKVGDVDLKRTLWPCCFCAWNILAHVRSGATTHVCYVEKFGVMCFPISCPPEATMEELTELPAPRSIAQAALLG